MLDPTFFESIDDLSCDNDILDRLISFLPKVLGEEIVGL
jgi:hypothetical protein